MNNKILIFLLTSILVLIINFIVKSIKNKVYKPKYENNIQKPGKLEGFIVKFLIFLDVILIFFTVIGVVMKEAEMAIVFACLTLFILAAIIVLKYSLNMTYQENAEYFILKYRNKEYQVFYEDIIDWQPSYNGIAVLDQTKPDKKYIRVNFRIFKPEILLRKIVDMAFDGKFNTWNQTYKQAQNREVEMVNYLVNNKYGYLIEDEIKKVKNIYQIHD